MTPEQYCFQKAAPAGSATYFAWRKLGVDQRQAVVAIAALYEELSEIVFECHEPAVAFAKISWWRTELAGLMTAKSDHPVMIALQQAVQRFSLSPSLLLDMLDGVAQNFNLSPFATFEDIMVHVMHTAGVRESLIATVVSQGESLSRERLYQFTLVLELVKHMQHLHRDVRRGLVYLAEDEMQQFQVSVAMLQTYRTTEAVRELLAYQAEKVERAYSNACDGLSREACREQSNLIARCKMAMAVLQAMRSSQFAVLENLIDITPLRRWWLASS